MKTAISRVRCALYTRKSSEEGLDQAFNSLDAQREACAAYVLSQAGEGWSALPQIYDDGGYSGGTMERPALQRLLADVQAGRLEVVVVYKVDRLTRSLGDFARIVEILDAAGASFVSVTQAFNTTTSMGRLTLNVLLSFAQFEREVTGERIRDKIAASKAKGMWMGGVPPLGYAVKDRALVVAEDEADTVRRIFQRYLALGSVHLLKEELAQEGYRSKAWVSQSGRAHGGVAFGRGPLFHILSNRTYLGETLHKAQRHPGRHAAIIDPDTFAAAQAMLARRGGPRRRAQARMAPRAPSAPLSGLIFDTTGERMSPVTARKSNGRRYRYYVSSSRQKGGCALPGVLQRVPAEALEALVLQLGAMVELVRPEAAQPWSTVRAALQSVSVGRTQVRLNFKPQKLTEGFDPDRARTALPANARLELESEALTVTIRTSLSRRGQGKTLIGPDGAPVQRQGRLDPALGKALAQAELFKQMLLGGKAANITSLARAQGLQPSHCERILRLAFLAPDLKRAILDGRAPAGLMLQRLRTDGVPDLWSEQRRQIAAYPA